MTSLENPESMMYEIIRMKEALNRMSIRLNNSQNIFQDLSLWIPKLTPPELGLLRVVSWFYVLYNEAGAVNVDFLFKQFSTYNLDSDSKIADYLKLVNQLRTYFQHNVNPEKPRDREIKENCEIWFKSCCGTYEPENDYQWSICLLNFLSETQHFFSTMEKCIREIERDESSLEILANWDIKRNRFHPPHSFDSIIIEVAADMGRESLDHIKLRNRSYSKWKNELETRIGDYNFNVEARKLIEHSILNETSGVLPITGKDILDTFKSVSPGPKVGEILAEAKKIYEDEPCSAELLLSKLKIQSKHIEHC